MRHRILSMKQDNLSTLLSSWRWSSLMMGLGQDIYLIYFNDSLFWPVSHHLFALLQLAYFVPGKQFWNCQIVLEIKSVPFSSLSCKIYVTTPCGHKAYITCVIICFELEICLIMGPLKYIVVEQTREHLFRLCWRIYLFIGLTCSAFAREASLFRKIELGSTRSLIYYIVATAVISYIIVPNTV